MIRYYLDSNIYRLMRPEYPFHSPDLLKTVDQAKGKVLFIFSDAHLADLKNSEKSYRDIDLAFMGTYVQDNYFAVNLNLEFQSYLASPLSAFYSKDYEAAEQIYHNPAFFDDLLKQLGDSPEAKKLKNLIDNFFTQPLSFAQSMPDLKTMGQANIDMLYKIFPDFSPNMTLKQFVENNMRFALAFKDDKKEMRKMKKYVAENFNKENYNWDTWKEQFNLKFKETPLNKTFLEVVDGMQGENRRNHWYSKVTNAYTLLEWFNITEERTGKRPKQFTFSSLNQDAQHVYYASFCDYLITDDRGMQLKAFIIYQLFNISTQVLTVKDFINRNHEIEANEESARTFTDALTYDLEHAFLLFSKPNITSGALINTYRTSHSYFNYFNRFQVVSGSGRNHCVLYCERNSLSNFCLYREIELLCKKIIDIFGFDDDQMGHYKIEEKTSQPHVRQWTMEKAIFQLLISENNFGYYLCFCLIFNK